MEQLDKIIHEAAIDKYPEWMLAAGPRKSGFIDGANFMVGHMAGFLKWYNVKDPLTPEQLISEYFSTLKQD
jgi:hypothetical protein